MPIKINILAWITASIFDLAYVSNSIASRAVSSKEHTVFKDVQCLAINAQLLFWCGAFYFAASISVSMSVLFLLLDRCFILLIPSKIGQTARERLAIVNGVLVVTQFFLFIIIFGKFEQPARGETGINSSTLL
jgi:hypothetical protein